MRLIILAVFAVQLLTPALARGPCIIENADQTEFLDNKVIKGTCSNNGRAIRCILNDDDSITCSGPSGTYTGYNKATLIQSACDCVD